MKPKTTTEVVTKALARSGPEITPEQIRLSDDAQPDKNKVYTQRDYNEAVNAGGGGGGGGGGGPAPDLSGYATTEQLNAEASARDTGDKANLGLIEANKKAIEAIEIPEGGESYDDTAIKKEISDLQGAFDTAVLAAQEGAENLEIELQSYAKKEDIPEGADLSDYAKTEYVDSADAALNDLIAANTQAIEELPTGGAASGINEVLTEGNTADPGQSLHFRVTEGSLPPFKRDTIEIEGGSGLRLGGVVSTYTLNEPFSIDTEHGVTMEFGSSLNRISGADIYIYGSHPKLDSGIEASIGLNGITYSADTTSLDIEPGYVRFAVGEYLSENFKIVANSDSSSVRATEVEATTVTATEFIGNGSKLTNLPTAGGGLPGQKWNLVTAHALPPMPGEAMWVEGDTALYLHASTADGLALGNASTSFSQYNVNGTCLVSAYKQGVGVEAVFQAMTVQMITQGGQTYWKITKTNHARFNLVEGNAYNFTASGLF